MPNGTKKKVPAPKGAELELEKPISIKAKEYKRRLSERTQGNTMNGGLTHRKNPNHRTYEEIIADAKVASAFSLGKQKEGKFSAISGTVQKQK